MSFSEPQANILRLLYEEQVQYSSELARTHQSLSKLYQKLAKIEHLLSDQPQTQLTRSEKKKRLYTRILTRRKIQNLEFEQAGLHYWMQRCNELIASHKQDGEIAPMHSWPAMPLSPPFLTSPCSPTVCPPWNLLPYGAINDDRYGMQAHYSDYPMAQVQRLSSPHDSSNDSGFSESLSYGTCPDNESLYFATNHLLSPIFNSPVEGSYAVTDRMSESWSCFESDEEELVPQTPSLLASATAGRSPSQNRRSHSANIDERVRNISNVSCTRRRSPIVDVVEAAIRRRSCGDTPVE